MQKMLRNKWTQRILFWFGSFLFFVRLFTTGAGIFGLVDVLYAFIFLVLLAPAVLLTNHWLIPSFLNRKKYLLFTLLFGLVNSALTLGNLWFFDHVIDHLLPGMYFINYYSFGQLLQFYMAFSIIAGLFQLSKAWFTYAETARRIDALEKQKMEAELKLLQNQLNPHFLFNSLNSIYSLALKKSDQTATAVMDLSEILRYSLYQSAQDWVPISNELEMVHRYIDLQQIRHKNELSIVFQTDVVDDAFKIPPLLIQPLFENAFKHGDTQTLPFIEAHLSISQSKLTFSIRNRIRHATNLEAPISGGVGLENIKRRLELLYPEKNQLNIRNDGESFMVTLEIYQHA